MTTPFSSVDQRSRESGEVSVRVAGDARMMIGYLDFLVAVDEHLEDDNLGYVMDATGLLAIARAALLVTGGDLMTVARWAGQCVERRYLDHAPPSGLDPQPLPPPRMWSEQDLYRLRDFG